MPIKIPDDLPARTTLNAEGVMVMRETDAVRQDIRPERFDGFIIAGAPVETMPFEQVTYWDELRRIFDWTQTHVHSCLNICWGAQAAVHHFYGMPKYPLPKKAF